MKVLIFLSTLLIASNVMSGGTTGAGEISNIYVNNGWTMVSIPDLIDPSAENQALNNPDGCTNNGYYAIVPTDSNYSALHATLMAAHFASKRVKFWVNGCGGQNGNHPKISSIWVYK